jgi:uncharacterized protein YfaA (DUF2138 family)
VRSDKTIHQFINKGDLTMFSKAIQFKRGKVISMVLAVLMLALAATPTLAWFEEGEVKGQAARPCRVISDGQEGDTVYCFQVMSHHPRPVATQPLLRPAIAKAEQMFIANQATSETIVQSTSEQ